MRLQRISIVTCVLACSLIAVADGPSSGHPLPDASWDHLPRWRGFNLLEKFNAGKNLPFREDDFRMIAELGFNFVRLPMDYRCWIVDGDWRRFREDTLREIDQAVGYGRKYGIHVMINFHRAPGYTVAEPPEKLSLWKDAEAQEVCALHWGTFAARYKGVPNRNLSFNLLNEPANVESGPHAAAIGKLVAAIRAGDPDRLIVCDARQWGNEPSEELIPLRVAQATRGYTPMEVTHYKASWVNSDEFPAPTWPLADVSGWLAGPGKRGQGAPLRVEGPFDSGTTLRIRVHDVSDRSRLVVKADGTTILDHGFHCEGGTGEWKRIIFKPEWKIYQNVYDRDYEAPIPDSAKIIILDNTEGDWMRLSEFALRCNGKEVVLPLRATYGQKPVPIAYHAGGKPPFTVPGLAGREWLRAKCVKPFQALQARGVGVMVGEFGAFNRTPHPIVMDWMRDSLENWKEAGWGWALWNFRGTFGILDSGRTDVPYEEYQGHQLDREMLKLLQSH
jgi:aryl-phospho-beta-D-glucosidase BglC (GH1 family)